MKKFLFLLVVLLGIVALLCSCECKHKNCSLVSCTTSSICVDCGKTISVAPGHTDGKWIIDKEATCTEDGSKHQICSACEETIKTETIEKLGHTDGEWITDKLATCTEDGSKHQICSACEETIKTETIEKLGHINSEWITDKLATCTENGSKHQVCSVCEETIKTETIVKLGHTDSEWITDKQATCTEDGRRYQICSACEETIKIETINNLGGHNNKTIEVTGGGLVGSEIKYQCSTCGTKTTGVVKPIEAYTTKGLCYKELLSHRNHREFSVISSGGYGKHFYKFELSYLSYNGYAGRPEFLNDFSENNTCSYDIYAFSYQAILKVTIKDEAGNIKTFEFFDFSY